MSMVDGAPASAIRSQSVGSSQIICKIWILVGAAAGSIPVRYRHKLSVG